MTACAGVPIAIQHGAFPLMPSNILVQASPCIPVEERETEMCEHKGVGHPDTIMDAVCAAASRELSLAYRAAYGRILHHNLDKGLLVGGASAPRFGGGTLLKPATIVICGRATRVDDAVVPSEIAAQAARRHISEHLHGDPGAFEIKTAIREGAANLKEIFARGAVVPLANDTSFGVGAAPYSPLERTVLAAGRVLASEAFRHAFPCAGDDYKVMGHRVRDAVTLTVALAFVDRHVAGPRAYFSLKSEICDYLHAQLPGPVSIRINTLDDASATTETGMYLTVSGMSAEMGDDGQVGRGNRASGLITPGRAMSIEACAGKNPVSHVGALYNVLAMLTADDIHRRVAGVRSVSVAVLSAIGAPIDCPQLAVIEISPPAAVTAAVREKAVAVAEERLKRIGELTDLILQREVRLY